jgi:hypothetical protein
MVLKRGEGQAGATPAILNLRKLLLRSKLVRGAGTIMLFVAGYIVFQRQEVRA